MESEDNLYGFRLANGQPIVSSKRRVTTSPVSKQSLQYAKSTINGDPGPTMPQQTTRSLSLGSHYGSNDHSNLLLLSDWSCLEDETIAEENDIFADVTKPSPTSEDGNESQWKISSQLQRKHSISEDHPLFHPHIDCFAATPFSILCLKCGKNVAHTLAGIKYHHDKHNFATSKPAQEKILESLVTEMERLKQSGDYQMYLGQEKNAVRCLTCGAIFDEMKKFTSHSNRVSSGLSLIHISEPTRPY